MPRWRWRKRHGREGAGEEEDDNGDEKWAEGRGGRGGEREGEDGVTEYF